LRMYRRSTADRILDAIIHNGLLRIATGTFVYIPRLVA